MNKDYGPLCGYFIILNNLVKVNNFAIYRSVCLVALAVRKEDVTKIQNQQPVAGHQFEQG